MFHFRHIRGALATLGLIALMGSPRHCSLAQAPGMVEFFHGNKMEHGLPLVNVATEMVVIGRDGWLHFFDPRDKSRKVREVDVAYRPLTAMEMRNRLRREFGNNFEVISTQNFLVVQPRGRGKTWPDLFEQSHRAFTHYMKRRGVKVRQGRFPMVAIVYPDQKAMYKAFHRLDLDVTRVSGLYSNESNRVMTHDGGHHAMIAATVRHEAAHQSAFNSGVHSRVNDTPKWISEGIGQMFEPPAMTDSRGATKLTDRVNRDSFRFISANYTGRGDSNFARDLHRLISGDELFKSDTPRAYALSWSMMFYLAEREPNAFARIVNHTSSRPPFREYTREKRVADVEAMMGVNVQEFGKRVSWFLQSL